MTKSAFTIPPTVFEATPQALIGQLRERWASLPDHRQPNPNTQYTLGDAALSAFAVFFLQSPSFLAYQQALRTRAESQYQITKKATVMPVNMLRFRKPAFFT